MTRADDSGFFGFRAATRRPRCRSTPACCCSTATRSARRRSGSICRGSRLARTRSCARSIERRPGRRDRAAGRADRLLADGLSRHRQLAGGHHPSALRLRAGPRRAGHCSAPRRSRRPASAATASRSSRWPRQRSPTTLRSRSRTPTPTVRAGCAWPISAARSPAPPDGRRAVDRAAAALSAAIAQPDQRGDRHPNAPCTPPPVRRSSTSQPACRQRDSYTSRSSKGGCARPDVSSARRAISASRPPTSAASAGRCAGAFSSIARIRSSRRPGTPRSGATARSGAPHLPFGDLAR